jgi:hypothetical protein
MSALPKHAPIETNPRLAVEYLPLDALTLDPENARIHKPAQVRQIAESIKAFSFNAPVLIDRDLKIIAGHGRVLACKHLGWSAVPVIRLEHLSPAQARAFAIADNRLTETSEWDEELLGRHLKVLSELDLDFSLEATGFTVGEIDVKIEGLKIVEDDAADPDEAPVAPGPAVAKAGDLWILGPHRILCASALEEISYGRLMGSERAAVMFADPPYNVPIDGHVSGKGKARHREFAMAVGEMSEAEFEGFLKAAFSLAAKSSAPGAVHFICMDWAHLYPLMTVGREVYGELLNLCVWTKSNGGMGGLYRSAHEMVLVFKAGRARHRNNVQLGKFGRNRTNVWAYPGANTFLRASEEADLLAQHPTPKPLQLVADALLDVSARGDVVLDPFLGSGSTLIAAERVGRVCRGLELDPLYVDLAIRRWQRQAGETALREDGASFAELEAQSAEERQ